MIGLSPAGRLYSVAAREYRARTLNRALVSLLLLVLFASIRLDAQEVPRLSALVTEKSAVELSWEPVKTQAYRIERAVDPAGRWTEIARLSSEVVRYVDASPPVPQAVYRLIVVWPEAEFSGEPVVVMTGSPFVPKTINTDMIVMTGRRFTPVTINTAGIAMTGLRFTPVTINTAGIAMTGRRFVPVTLTTGGIVMTGRRFAPATITTQPIVMTGTRGES